MEKIIPGFGFPITMAKKSISVKISTSECTSTVLASRTELRVLYPIPYISHFISHYSITDLAKQHTFMTSRAISGVISTHFWKHSKACCLLPARRKANPLALFSCLVLSNTVTLLLKLQMEYLTLAFDMLVMAVSVS